ncbi:hypothetical protein AMELA_G00063750 [Ameiurus melas]|uniref:Uncharacterized protein n=1 Tax=Ameiurus melas TaxID=219545 RepID=A0A7J6B254_AMEME|nr:hypothetical protein AMELA_G00063750 [Ameiurus melas]
MRSDSASRLEKQRHMTAGALSCTSSLLQHGTINCYKGPFGKEECPDWPSGELAADGRYAIAARLSYYTRAPQQSSEPGGPGAAFGY